MIGIVGWKNSGKTGLVERLVFEITRRGYSVSTVKHAHHMFQVDKPGTDSFRHRTAGAWEVLLASSSRWALINEGAKGAAPSLRDLLKKLEPVDLVIVEGYKKEEHVKIEARRAEAAGRRLADRDENVIAVATDVQNGESGVPEFDLDDSAGIADFIIGWFKL